MPAGSLDRLESDDGYDSTTTLDPRFAVLPSQCLSGDHRSDLRQLYLFEDIFEDFDDGTLCALYPRSVRNSEACLFFPLKKSPRCSLTMQEGSFHSLFSLPLHSVLLRRQWFRPCLTLTIFCRVPIWKFTRPHLQTASAEAAALRPMIKSVRELTLPYLELEYCNAYRGTYGKTLPWFIVILMLLSSYGTGVIMTMFFLDDVAVASLSSGYTSNRLVHDCFLE